MSNAFPPLTPDEADNVVARTAFVSSSVGGWEVEIRSGSHSGTLLDASVKVGFGDEHRDVDEDVGNDDLALPADVTTGTQDTDTTHNAPIESDKALHEQEKDIRRKDLEQKYDTIRTAKEDLSNAGAGQMGKLMRIQELKEKIAKITAEFGIRHMEVEYWTKLRQLEEI